MFSLASGGNCKRPGSSLELAKGFGTHSTNACSIPIFYLRALRSGQATALEVQGFITKDCERHVGIVIHATAETVELMNLEGDFRVFAIDDIELVPKAATYLSLSF